MAALTYPYTLTAGQPENVDQLNSNLAAVQAVLNGAVDASNLASGAVTSGKIASLPHVRAKLTANQAVGSGAADVLLLGGEDFDSDGMHSTTTNTGRLTCVTSGLYVVAASCVIGVATGGGPRLIIRKNGSTYSYGAVSGTSAAGTAGDIVRLAAGDYVEVAFDNTTGTSLTVTFATLAAHWVCP